MTEKKPYYITTAIAYTSGKPHIGNTYEIILADAIARFRRKQGYDVRFQTGSDEHGQKIETRAIENGTTPKEFVDSVSSEIKRIYDLCNVSYDRFIRTTDEDHERQVQKIFKRFYDQGDIYLGKYKGLYCPECEAFYTPSQAKEGNICPVCGGRLHEEQEDAYFFKMSKYADRLIDYINTHPDFIKPESRKNEMMNNFLKPGLQDLCVSRTSFKWGIHVDFDPKHVVYVWLDALTNYITGLGYDAEGNSGELYKKYWPADLHLIGKDIIRFHTIYWPIFLMALGEPLPKQVFGHPWLLQGGEKMSKSKGNVIYADDMVDLFGVDAVRYFVVHEMPYENDGIITWQLMVERYNSDLANILGNLVSRTIAMSNKYFGGVLKDTHATESVDDDVKAVITGCRDKVIKKMDDLRAADSLTEIFNVFRRLNKYIDETEPWVLAKDPAKSDRLAAVLYNLADGIMTGASLLYPFMPDTAEKIAKELGCPLRDFDDLDKTGLIPDGTKVAENPAILFERKKEDEILAKTSEIEAKQRADAKAAKEKAVENLLKAGKISREDAEAELTGKKTDRSAITIEDKEQITYDDFARLQLVVAEVLECEAVKKSKKLLKFKLKIGNETRQILSGIHNWYEPDELIGKKVMALINLAPRTMMGLESQGMILSAEDADGNVSLMTPMDPDMPGGSSIS